MLNIDEMTHPHTVWKIVPRYNQEAFMVADNLTNIRLERYFNVWQTFKETYIKPSIELIKKIDFDALHPHIELHDKYENIINKWRAYFHMSISLCAESTKALLHYIDSQEPSADHINDEEKSIVCAAIDDIRKEKEFLTSSVHIIEAFAEQCQHKFAKSLVAEVENISKSEGKIEALKDEV